MNIPTPPEVAARLPELMHERQRLRRQGLEPRAVKIPARLNRPYEGPYATDLPATCLGLPVEWTEDEQWGLIV